jgi:hypothetical protein
MTFRLDDESWKQVCAKLEMLTEEAKLEGGGKGAEGRGGKKFVRPTAASALYCL